MKGLSIALAATLTFGHAYAAAPVTDTPLTVHGWGPIRIGMSLKDLDKALGRGKDFDAVMYKEMKCVTTAPARAPKGLHVMIEEDRVTRVSLYDQSPIKTDRGFKVDDPASKVKAAYGKQAEVTPHHYIGLPAEYVTVWEVKGKKSASGYVDDPAARGFQFETDEQKTITAIHAGSPSIQYVEGCL